jgi:putative ABC transport system permease protein
MSDNNKPPRWAQMLLRKLAAPETLEEVEGDMLELFMQWEKEHGKRQARLRYIRTVFTLLRPFRKATRPHGQKYMVPPLHFMIGSYFKMSWRTLLKNRLSSAINIAGLTIGLTTSIIILLVVSDQFQFDRFHTNLPDIHILMKNQKTNDGISTGMSTPGPMAEVLRTTFPEVKFAARVSRFHEQPTAVSDKTSYESGIYADPDLFNIMTFPSIAGDALNALNSNSAIVITRDMATKLFADQNPLGKTVVFNKHHTLTVGAVIENIPATSTLKFDMVIPFALFEKENLWLKKWDDNRIMTWMQLQPSTDLTLFNDKATQVLPQDANNKLVSLFAYPLKDLYLHGNFSNGVPNGGRITAVKIMIGFGVFMLLIACINFMNIVTAQSEHRAREIGVRKVLGASRKGIIVQFMNESLVITFISLFAAIGIAVMITPWFNTVTHSSIHFDFKNPKLWASALTIGLITALLAGSYPSFFLSRFIPARVLKGRTTNTKGGGLRKVLVTFQFSISAFIVIATIIMYSQFEYVKNRPLGYEQENLIDISLDSALSSRFAYIKNEILKIPTVRSATGGSENILYSGGFVTGMDWPGKDPGEDLAVAIADVEYDWTKTIGIKITRGRDFSPDFASDASACMLNESAVAKMGLEEPVGSMVGGHRVIGVFQDFVYNNPIGSISPIAVYFNPAHINHLYVRVQNDSEWRQTLSRVEKIIKTSAPDSPFNLSFTKEEYQQKFEEIAGAGLMISIFGGMTIFIAGLGLFGLSGFVAEKRSKEMSIRKVFGASVSHLLTSLTQDFLRPVFYALLLVIPSSILIARAVLSNISYRVPLQWWMFAAGGTIVLLIAIAIVFYHGLRTAKESPVLRLRNES